MAKFSANKWKFVGVCLGLLILVLAWEQQAQHYEVEEVQADVRSLTIAATELHGAVDELLDGLPCPVSEDLDSPLAPEF